MRLGIVPAGGGAMRFGGIYKELLPISNGKTALENCVDSLSFCDKVLVLTTPEKICAHASTLWRNAQVIFSISDNTLLSSIALSFPFRAERTYFVMPDTYFQPVSFKGTHDFELLIFKTENSRRFGVLVNDTIIDKKYMPGTFNAWGALSWSDKVVDLWKDKTYFDFTDAINDAIKTFGYVTSDMEYYYDFATMDDYIQWLTQR